MQGNYLALPFPDGTIDMVTFMLAPDDANEAYRILKPGGYAIIERTGERDKENIKKYFGRDSKGNLRGYRSGLPSGSISKICKKVYKKACFTEIQCINGFWKTWYNTNGLKTLLEETPLIKDYNNVHDKNIFNTIVKKLSTNNGIETTQHRILIIARK